MKVRLADEDDFHSIVEMARMNMEETRPEIEFDEDVAYATCYQYLDTASPTIYIAERDAEPIGFLLADMYSYRAANGIFTTQEVLFVRPEHRGTRAAVLLMKTLIDWSKQLGAKEIVGGNDNEFQSDRTARFLEHFGFKRVGHAMRRVL